MVPHGLKFLTSVRIDSAVVGSECTLQVKKLDTEKDDLIVFNNKKKKWRNSCTILLIHLIPCGVGCVLDVDTLVMRADHSRCPRGSLQNSRLRDARDQLSGRCSSGNASSAADPPRESPF